MSMPVNLFIVRHGESIGNVAKRMSEKGDHSLIERLRDTHTADWKLTKKGEKQAEVTGEFLNRLITNQRMVFDRMYVSSYARAMMTAGRLRLIRAQWMIDTRITERDWGSFDRYTEDERREKFAEALHMREVEPFFWAPPRGETFNSLILRVRDFIASLARVDMQNAIVVCHGEVMKAFRIVFMQLTPWEYADMEFSEDPLDRVRNCQVDHYSRRDPKTLTPSSRLEWLQVYRPAEGLTEPVIAWKYLPRKRFSSDELLQAANKLSQDFADLDL